MPETQQPDKFEEAIRNAETAAGSCPDSLQQKLSELISQFADQLECFTEHDAENLRELLLVTCARVRGRYGKESELPLAYHNEFHILELLTRLEEIWHSDARDELPAFAWPTLAIFAACHDLRQDFTQHKTDLSAGDNEKASAMEALRLLSNCQLENICGQDIRRVLTDMIHGTTFATAATLDQPGGALAPELLFAAGPLPDWYRQMVLLAADLDTASVAENFDEYIESAIRLCQELLTKINPGGQHERFSLDFMTWGQSHFFYSLHRFHSPLSKRVFAERKDRNAKLLERFSYELKGSYDPAKLPDSDAIFSKAQQIASKLSNP